MALKPYLTAGVALASAGAIVAATPAVLTPTDEVKVAATAPALLEKNTLTVDELQLLGIENITLQMLSDVFFEGAWGGFVTGDENGDCGAAGAVCPFGFTGLSYYVGDEILDSIVNLGIPVVSPAADFLYNDVTSYFYETGTLGLAEHLALLAGVDPLLVDVALNPADYAALGIVLGTALAVDALPLPPALANFVVTSTTIFWLGGGAVPLAEYVVNTIISSLPFAAPAASTATVEAEDEAPEVTPKKSESETETLSLLSSEEESTPEPEVVDEVVEEVEEETEEEVPAVEVEAVEEVEETDEEEAKPFAKAFAKVSDKIEETEEKLDLVRDSFKATPFDSVVKPTGKGGGAFKDGDTNFQKTVQKLKDTFNKSDDGGDDSSDGGDSDGGDE